MDRNKVMLTLCIFLLSGAFSCGLLDRNKEENQKVIRVEKPVTKVDVTIDTANAFNRMFLDSSVLNRFLESANLGDTMSNRLRSFYNSRNFQFAWFSPEGIPEHTISFWNLLKNYLNYSRDSSVYDKSLARKMEDLIHTDSLVIRNDSAFRRLELKLTRTFYLYADHAYATDANFDMKSLEWYIPRKKMTLESMLDSVLAGKGQYAPSNAPTNPQFTKLRETLQKYKEIRNLGGWPTVHSKVEVMKVGYRDPAVRELKLRLKAEGFLEGEDSSFTNTYDAELAGAVNALKASYGYKQDGTAGKTFLREVNIPVDERIQQILINMERMRWIPTETRDTGRAILVNIPEYKLHVYEGGRPAWDMDVVVGKEGNKTTVFTGRLSTIVFSPYWNVPSSIAKKEILPKGWDYMVRNHFEFFDNGRVRQKPGPWNALGLVKFIFPNSYDIYFHDSPVKSLFNRDKRSYSHGCIRLKEPAKFAEYLLQDTVKWRPEKIDSMMHSGEQKYIRIRKSLPVLITYFTAWVNDSSILNFREDIYGHDGVMANKLFLNALKTTRVRPPQVVPKPKKDSTRLLKNVEKQRKDHQPSALPVRIAGLPAKKDRSF